jgi:leucyl/phenylalanyl-tRNA---protein transferase
MNVNGQSTRPDGSSVASRRATLFRETPTATLQRWALGIAWALRPKRIANFVKTGRVTLAHFLKPSRDLPDPATLAADEEIIGLATDLSPDVLMDGYVRGLFPLGHLPPPKWMFPLERAVVRPRDFHISSRLRGMMRKNRYRVTFDTDFEGVIAGCAEPRRGLLSLTWITPRVMRAYAKLFDEGHVHSFEVWNGDGALVGGGYGVAVGRVFVIESQFFRESNASKIGFAVLAWHLAKWGFTLMDNKWLTPATERAGFKDVPRQVYLAQLPERWDQPIHPGRWEAEADSKTVAAGPPDVA